MKKISMGLAMVMMMGAVASAQTDKGDWMVGGNITINTTSGNSQFTMKPSAGYFFAHNFVAGGQFELSLSKSDNIKTTVFSLGPFARYYIDIRESHFKPFVHADFNFGTSKINISDNSNTVTSFFIGGGGAYFINSNIALEAVAGYNRSKIENLHPTNGFLFRVGFQVHLLGGKK